MSTRRVNPLIALEDRKKIIGNTLENQVEKPVEKSPEDVRINETDLIPTKQKENNIGTVSTPEQRVGDNQKSQNLSFENNTPESGQQPFESEELKPLIPEPQVPVIDRSVGFTFNRGNFFVNPMDSLPEADVFAMSQQQDVSNEKNDTVGNRPRTFKDFFN